MNMITKVSSSKWQKKVSLTKIAFELKLKISKIAKSLETIKWMSFGFQAAWVIAQKYLQPHYSNGVFGNVYLSAGQH